MKFTLIQRLFLASLTTLISIIIIISCRKLDSDIRKIPPIDKAKKFLNLPAGAPSPIKRIYEKIKKENDETHFLDWFAEKFGYALWDKAPLMYTSSNAGGRGNHLPDTVALIPLVYEKAEEVYSFLACAVGEDSVRIRLFRGDSYAAYGKTFQLDTLSSEFVAMQCMFLEYRVFGHRRFRVNDLELFLQSPAGTSNESRFIYLKDVADSNKQRSAPHTSGRSADYYVPIWTQYCVEYVIDDYDGGGNAAPPDESPAHTYGGSNCYDIVSWSPLINGGGTTVTVPTGGGGGGNWYDEAPCRAPLPECGNGLTEGWVTIDDVDPSSPYNVLWVDTIGISNSIQTVYPCLYAFLNDSLPNINYLAQLAGASVFKDSAYMHLIFDTSTTNTTENDTVAATKAIFAAIGNDGFWKFTATIKFNGWHLRNATKEFMVSTIIHEVMHAIFRLRWKQYEQWRQNGQGSIDSFYMKSHFPIYWETYVVNGVPSGAIDDHLIMATDYFNLFNSLVASFYNPAAPQSLRDSVIKAMNYGGLVNTTAWKLLGGQGIDTCRYKNIQFTAEKAAIGTITAGGSCLNFTTHYADSFRLRPSCN